MDLHTLQSIAVKLENFVDYFSETLGNTKRNLQCHHYLSGLLADGERKSVEPMAKRIEGASVQNLQQFINQSPWDSQLIMQELRHYTTKKLGVKTGILILDDVSFPKKGKLSVGVGHQYCGALGKVSNCQSVVTWQLSNREFNIPANAQLYLPQSWIDDPALLDRAGVPNQFRSFQEKPKIALDLLDELLDEGVNFDATTFDAGYGYNKDFLAELDERKVLFVGQTRDETTFWPIDTPFSDEPRNSNGLGRPKKHVKIVGPEKSKTAAKIAEELFADKKNIQEVDLPLKSGEKSSFVAVRVFETTRSPKPNRTLGVERWLLSEKLGDGTHKYYVSNFPASTLPAKMILIARERWKVEQGYQHLKEELGLDHFEGRSWLGFHHHICLCYMAFCFLMITRKDRKKKFSRHFQLSGDGSMSCFR